jgi:hypothetical protein
MPKPRPQPEVLVLGSHPACYFAAALLKSAGAPVMHCTIPGEVIRDRLVHVNPELLNLHKMLAGLKRQVELTPIYGVLFLSDDPVVRSECNTKTILAYVASLKQIRAAMIDMARKHKAELVEAKHLEIHGVDEDGAHLTLNSNSLRPRLLIVGGALGASHRRMLGITPPPDAEAPRRYTYLRLKGSKWIEHSAKPLMPMSLDLRGNLQWGWLLPMAKEVQVAVEQSADSATRAPVELLGHWVDVLIQHKVLKADHAAIDLSCAEWIDLPLAAALSQESVANRTLLIGPAGGFYTACAEDIYPNCWSALFAADVAHKALRERHVQDAIQPYRQKWGTTLGDYLRGPQQNLRFLLPLVYRNPVMTARMCEAILSGASVVR